MRKYNIFTKRISNIISNKMKIHFLVISLGVIFWGYAQNAQNNNSFSETEAVAAAITPEGKKVFVGNILSDNDVFITLCNERNEPLWSVPIPSNKIEKVTSVALAQNGDIMIAGTVATDLQVVTDAWLACISPNGKLKWQKEWGMKTQTRIAAIQAMNDGDFCLVGYTDNALNQHDGWVCKVNSMGEEVWTKTFGWDKTDEFTACTQRKNGNILLAGFTNSKGAGQKDMLLVEIDAEAAVSWLRVYGKNNSNEEATAVLESPKGEIILCGRTNEKNPTKNDFDGRALLLDETGKMKWSDTQGGLNMDNYFSIAAKAESFVIVGTTIDETSQNTKAWAISYNYTGTKIWDKKWENHVYFSHIIPTESGYCISTTQETNKLLSAHIIWIDEQGILETALNPTELLGKAAPTLIVAEIDKPLISLETQPSIPPILPTKPAYILDEKPEDAIEIPENEGEIVSENEDITIEELLKHTNENDKDTSDKHLDTEIVALKSVEEIPVMKTEETPILPPQTEKEADKIISAETKETSSPVIAENKAEEAPVGEKEPIVKEEKVLVQNVYVLSIGISSYQNKQYNIHYSASDAELFALSMTGMEGNGFGKVNVEIYTNEQAIGTNIQRALSEMAEKVQENDLICIYLAGRGYYDKEGIPYLMMNDESESAGEKTAQNLNLYTFIDNLQKVKGDKMLMTDFFTDPSVTYPTIKWLRNIESNNLCVLASVTEDEIALEKTEWGHSAFAKNMLEGLSGKADTDHNYFIYFSELSQYLSKELPSLTHDLQHPQVVLMPKKDVMVGIYRN